MGGRERVKGKRKRKASVMKMYSDFPVVGTELPFLHIVSKRPKEFYM